MIRVNICDVEESKESEDMWEESKKKKIYFHEII